MNTNVKTTQPYTPGPWEMRGNGSFAALYPKDRPERIADIYCPLDQDDGGTLEGNRALLTAAPDLLDALERLAHVAGDLECPAKIENIPAAVEQARAAIAKATPAA